MDTLICSTMDSPVGRLTLVAGDRGLAAILWPGDNPRRVPLTIAGQDLSNPLLGETERQLGEYFSGRRTAFDLPLDFRGTPFQLRVWHALTRIPFGETRSYGELARELGNPQAMRAVGAANSRNPISIVAPCHRVIGASGRLTGFAGGLGVKAYLLALERPADLASPPAPSPWPAPSPASEPPHAPALGRQTNAIARPSSSTTIHVASESPA